MFHTPFGGRATAIALSCLAFAGCASFDRMKPAPAQTQPIAIQFSKDTLGMNDLPLGAYRVPDSEVIVSGHQSTGGGAAAFGLIGVLVADAIDTHRGANAVSANEKALHIKLDQEARADIEALLGAGPLGQKFSFAKGQGKTLDILPAVILNFTDDTHARPYVEFKVALLDASGNSVWDTRYYASTGAERTMDEWAAQDGAALKASISASLRQAVKVMLSDVSSPYARDDKAVKLVQSRFPFVKQRLQVTGLGLFEDDQYIAFLPKIGDASTIAGVNILDKSVTVYRPATADDKITLLPDAPKAATGAPTAASAASAAAPATVAAAAAPASAAAH
jgi:hypothetical protein